MKCVKATCRRTARRYSALCDDCFDDLVFGRPRAAHGDGASSSCHCCSVSIATDPVTTGSQPTETELRLLDGDR